MAEADVGAAQSSCCSHSGNETLVGGDSDVGVGQVVGGGTIEQGCKESDYKMYIQDFCFSMEHVVLQCCGA